MLGGDYVAYLFNLINVCIYKIIRKREIKKVFEFEWGAAMVTFKRRLTKYLPITRPESAFSYGNIFSHVTSIKETHPYVTYGDTLILTLNQPSIAANSTIIYSNKNNKHSNPYILI